MIKATITTILMYLLGVVGSLMIGECIVDYMWAGSVISLVVAFLPRTRELRHRLLPTTLLVSLVTFVLNVTV